MRAPACTTSGIAVLASHRAGVIPIQGVGSLESANCTARFVVFQSWTSELLP